MKSFFQRFQDSQPGASKSRTKDPAYRQWIPSKSDKDRAQLSDGVEPRTASSSKRLPTKSAGLRPPDVPAPGPLGRVTTDNTTRFSTIPAASINRHFPPSLPLSQTHPAGPSTSKVPNLKPPDEAKEKSKPATKRSEAAEISGNEKDTALRVKSGRPSRSAQTTEPLAPQQHQFWRPSDMKVLNPEKEKKRQKKGEEIPGDDGRPPKKYDTDPKNERPDDYWTDRGEGSNRQKTELKELERGTKERRRDKAAESRKVEKWEQQERDIAQVREREARENERLKERKEKGREKVREKGNGRDREARGEAARDQDRAEERDKKKVEGREKEKGAREQQDQELQAREQRERERKERRAKERQIEKERWERDLLERMRREREKARERQQKEQKERERLQQEKWEREQEEIERKELERLERERLKEQGDVRRKEPEPQRQGLDPAVMDLLQVGRERQDQKKRERMGERDDKERRWRSDKLSENPIPVLVDTRTSDESAPRQRSSKPRKEGASDSEREVRELDRRRTSRMLTQLDTPPKPDQRNVQDTEAPRPSEYYIKTRGPKQHIYSSGGGDPSTNRQHLKPTTRDEGYGSEFNQSTQNSPDPPGRDVLLTAPPIQQIRSPSFPLDVPQFLNPPGHVISTQNQRSDLVTLTGHSSHPTQHPTRATFPDTSNQVRQSPKEVMELVNRPTVPVLHAQLPVHQTRPAAATGQIYDTGHVPSRPALVPTEVTNLPALGPPATNAFPTPAHTHASQENRPFPSAATFQASHPSVPPPSRVPLNISDQPTPPLRGTHPTNVPATPQSHEGRPVLPIAKSKSSRPNAQISLEPSAPETRPFLASHRPDPNTLSGPSVQDRHTPTSIPQTIAPSVHGVSLSSSAQQNHQTNTTTKNSPVPNPSYLLTNSGHPSAENTAHNDKESPEPHSSRKELARQILPTQPVLPVTSVPTTRPVAVNKRSNTVPPRYEDSIPTSVDPKVLNTSRPSPTYHLVKIQDTVPPTDITNILQPNRTDPRLRTSPHADKISLQESTLPTSRRYHTEIPGYDSRTDRPLQPIVPPALAGESRNVASENKQRDPNLARMLSPPSIDNQDTTHSRHQRYYSEGEIVRHRGKPSPKSQPIEDAQALKAPQVSFVESKRGGTQPSTVEPDANPGAPNVAFRAPAAGGMTTDRKFLGAETQPIATGMLQVPGVRLPQPSQGPGANGVSHLVSHYERIEQTAQLGGTIPRPGTTVPRDTARVTTHEPPSQTVPPISHFSHSLSASVPQIERPRTSNGVRPPTSNVQPPISKTDRTSRLDNSSSVQPPAIKPIAVEPRYDQIPFQTTGDGHSAQKNPRPNPVAQNAPRPNTADSNHGTSHRPRPDAPALSHKVSYSEGVVANESKGVRATTELNNDPSKPPPSNETMKSTERSQLHRTFPIHEDKVQARQHSNTKEEPEIVYHHPAHPAPSQAHSDSLVRRDDTGNSARDRAAIYSSTPSRQRKDSSPRIHPEDNSTKVHGAGEVSAEDPRALQHRPNHNYGHPRASAPAVDTRHSSQRTEPTQVEANRLASVPTRKNISETNVTTSQPVSSAQHLPFDERTRNKSAQDHTPHAPERSPVYINPASISPQRTGNSGYSKLEEESRPRHHRSAVQVKDPRLADLLAPPKANDVAHHSYLRDARRTLASKLEREPNVSPNSVANNLTGGPETAPRLRSSSGRGEHSPRNIGADSNPSGPSNTSPSYTQHPDLSAKDYSYVRVSPNASQHTPSPHSKPVLTEVHVGSQPEIQHGEDLRYGSGYLTSRQPLTRERAQDHVPNAEDVYSRKHDQTAPYTTRDVNARVDDTNRVFQIPSNSISYTSEQRAERTVAQRDGSHKDTYDVSQSVSIGNSRTRSESRNAQDTSVNSRHPYTTSRETYNTLSSQTQTSPHVPASNHVPSSAPTIPAFGPSPDQVQYSRSPSSTQQQVPASKEVPTPPQPIQAPPMASTPSKRNYIAPLPPETQNPNSSAPQPTTPKAYEIWLPPSSSVNDHGPARSTAAPSSRREREREREPRRHQDYTRRTSTIQQVLREAPLISLQPAGPDPRMVAPYHYLKTRKIRTVSLVSMEAQDGAASTVIGSPTASILSQAPIYIPPEQDPIVAAREWTEAAAILPGQRVRRPGLVWADLDDTPPLQQVEHRRPEPRSSRSRRPRLPSSRSREASDTDQPSS